MQMEAADPSQSEFVYVLWVNLSKATTVMFATDKDAGRTGAATSRP
jgi:hypothetical protein